MSDENAFFHSLWLNSYLWLNKRFAMERIRARHEGKKNKKKHHDRKKKVKMSKNKDKKSRLMLTYNSHRGCASVSCTLLGSTWSIVSLGLVILHELHADGTIDILALVHYLLFQLAQIWPPLRQASVYYPPERPLFSAQSLRSSYTNYYTVLRSKKIKNFFVIKDDSEVQVHQLYTTHFVDVLLTILKGRQSGFQHFSWLFF